MNERVMLVRTVSSGTEYRIDGNEYVFGKAPSMCNGVIAESGAVSRTHCRFVRLSDGGYGVEDLHSANGTRLNGYHLEPGSVYPLQEGDSLTIADVECQVFYCVKHALNRSQRNGA